jgi:ElaB/YqjD/DUF883 family membrane-anchored ribosome-binding protein
MGQDPGTRSAQVTANQDPEQIQREIEETRERLGDTVEALAQKADVKAQAKEKIAETRATVSHKTRQLCGKAQAQEASPNSAATATAQALQQAKDNPVPVAAMGAFAIGFLAGRLTKR